MPNLVPRSGDIAKVAGRVPRVTKGNLKGLLSRISANELTEDDILALRAIIEKDTRDYRSLSSAEDEAFRRLSSRILSERSLRGDLTKHHGVGNRVETPFDDLYDLRDQKYGRGSAAESRKLLEE